MYTNIRYKNLHPCPAGVTIKMRRGQIRKRKK